MPLSSAAREKLRRETMSQKILRDLRFMNARGRIHARKPAEIGQKAIKLPPWIGYNHEIE
jgi:hypothetical protein